MLVSHKKRFIFIHVYKVAGTSVRRTLEPYCEDYLKRRLAAHMLRLRLRWPKLPCIHMTAAEVRATLPPEVYDNYFKFAFVRNPWDWQVSLFHYTRNRWDHPQRDQFREMSGFDEYIRWRVAEDVQLQSKFVTDQTGNYIVDYVGRMEALNDDFAHVCRTIGIPTIELPHRNKSAHKDYRKYYTDETRELVAQAYKTDIERFGYDFDGIAPGAGLIVRHQARPDVI